MRLIVRSQPLIMEASKAFHAIPVHVQHAAMPSILNNGVITFLSVYERNRKSSTALLPTTCELAWKGHLSNIFLRLAPTPAVLALHRRLEYLHVGLEGFLIHSLIATGRPSRNARGERMDWQYQATSKTAKREFLTRRSTPSPPTLGSPMPCEP